MALPPLKIVISATTTALDKSLTKTKANLAKFAKIAKAAMAAVASAVVAAAGALAVLAKRAFAVIDSQAKLARSLKTSVASVQILGRAAELAGVEMGQLNMAAIALDRRLSQAATGTGPAVKALKRLGLTAEELADLDLDKRVSLINARITELVPSTQRAAVAAALFGDRAGFAIQRLDPATIAQATEEMRSLGVLVSDIDAAQIERTNDAVSQLSLITEGLGNQIAVAVAPAMESFAVALANSAKEGGLLNSVISGTGRALAGLGKSATATGVIMSNFGPVVWESLGRAANAVKSLLWAMQALNLTIAKQFVEGEKLELANQRLETAMENMGSAFEKATEGSGALKNALKELLESYNATVPPGVTVTKTVDGIGDAATTAAGKIGKLTVGYDALREKVKAALETTKAEAAEMARLEQNIQSKASDAIMSSITNYKNAGQAAKKFAATVISELLRVLVIQKAVAAFGDAASSGGGWLSKLVGFGTSFAQSAFSGVSLGGGGGGVQVSSLGPPVPNPRNFEGGGYTGDGARSGGIDGRGGMHAIVHPNETVIDHTRPASSSGGGGTVVNQSFNLAPGLTADALAAIRADILPQAQAMAMAGVADARRRGGQRGAALR